MMPKAPSNASFVFNAESINDGGSLHAVRYICGDVAVVSSVDEGEFRVSVVALRSYRLTERDMAIVRRDFGMADAVEDPRRGTRFHEPPRMLRKPCGVAPDVLEPEAPTMTSRRALHLAFMRPQVMRDA